MLFTEINVSFGVNYSKAHCTLCVEGELQNALASKLSLPNVGPQNVILGIIDCQSSFVAMNHLLLLYK